MTKYNTYTITDILKIMKEIRYVHKLEASYNATKKSHYAHFFILILFYINT